MRSLQSLFGRQDDTSKPRLANYEFSEVSKLLFTPHTHVDPGDMDIVHTYALQTSAGASKPVSRLPTFSTCQDSAITTKGIVYAIVHDVRCSTHAVQRNETANMCFRCTSDKSACSMSREFAATFRMHKESRHMKIRLRTQCRN